MKAKPKTRRIESIDLQFFIQGLLERKRCPVLDDEGETTGQTVKILMATADLDDTINVDMDDGRRFIVSIIESVFSTAEHQEAARKEIELERRESR